MAREHSVPAYVIFHDSTLARIAEIDPDSREALGELPGIGMAKLQHERADEGGVGQHAAFGQIGGDAVALLQAVVFLPVFLVARVVFVVHDFEIAAGSDGEPHFLDALCDYGGTADEDRCGQFGRHNLLGGV